jgi:two-component system response regulator NreC
MPKIRVLIADDHAVLRAGLRLLLEAQSDMRVVGEAGDGPAAVSQARDLEPDVVLLDLSMPGPPGTSTIERLVGLDPRPRILVLTMHDDPAYLQAALQAGASGYIVKRAADVALLQAIRIVHRGGSFVNLTRPGEATSSEDVRCVPCDSPAAGQPRLLSRREVEVLCLLAQGHTNQEVANRLSISIKTVETHRKRLSDKLGLKSRSELFRFAVESNLLDGLPPPPPRRAMSRRCPAAERRGIFPTRETFVGFNPISVRDLVV